MKGITTIEQSTRLLKAGLSPDTADMWAINVHPLKFEGCKTVNDGDPFTKLSLYNEDPLALVDYKEVPLWSMAALWTLLNESGIYYYEYNTGDTVESVMESLVYAVERGVKCGIIKTKSHDKE